MNAWLAIAGVFVLLAIVYVELTRAVDALLAVWRDHHVAGELVDVDRPSLAEAAGVAYFGAWADNAIIETPRGTFTVTGVSGFEPDDVTIDAGVALPLDGPRRHLRLVDEPDSQSTDRDDVA